MKTQIVPAQNIKSFMADMVEAYKDNYKARFGKIDDHCIDEQFIKDVCYKRRYLYIEVVEDDKRLGGLMLRLLNKGKRAKLEFMFTKTEHQNKGVATFLWKSLKEYAPGVKTWIVQAPYFDVPAIHFLVNKFGFKIIELVNSYNAPQFYGDYKANDPWTDGYLFFEKRVSKVEPI